MKTLQSNLPLSQTHSEKTGIAAPQITLKGLSTALSLSLVVLLANLSSVQAYEGFTPSAGERIQISQALPPLQPGNGYNNNYSNNYNNAPLQGRVVTAPAGTFVSATFSSPVSSQYARVGDRFMANLGSPVSASDGSVILPVGTQLEAQVVMVKPAGRTGRPGELDIRFTSAQLPNGQRIPLAARIQTDDRTGILKGGTTGGRVKSTAIKTGVGAGLGALAGTALGPMSGGEVSRGAIYGTAVGGGLGLAKSLWDKGDDAVLEAGQPLNVVLDQPISTSPMGAQQQYNNNQYAPNYNNYQPNYNNYNPVPNYPQYGQ